MYIIFSIFFEVKNIPKEENWQGGSFFLLSGIIFIGWCNIIIFKITRKATIYNCVVIF